MSFRAWSDLSEPIRAPDSNEGDPWPITRFIRAHTHAQAHYEFRHERVAPAPPRGLSERNIVHTPPPCRKTAGSRPAQSRKSIMSMALDTMTLLSDTNQVINQLRHDLLKQGIQPRLQSFCKLPKSADATQFLFGDNLSERIKAAAQGGRVAKRPYGPPGSFYGPKRIGLDWICLTTTHVLQDILAVLHK